MAKGINTATDGGRWGLSADGTGVPWLRLIRQTGRSWISARSEAAENSYAYAINDVNQVAGVADYPH